MPDKLGLLDGNIPLQDRYDKYLIWMSQKNNAVSEFIAKDLEISVSEVDVFSEIGNFEEDEFSIIDEKKFDIGHLFIIVRSPENIRRIIYSRHEEILKSSQPLNALKSIADEFSNYTSIEDLVKKISGACWKSISSYLKQREIIDGTISKAFRPMLIREGNRIISGKPLSSPIVAWLIRAINHDKAKSLGIFTNDVIRDTFHDDHILFLKIQENIADYEND